MGWHPWELSAKNGIDAGITPTARSMQSRGAPAADRRPQAPQNTTNMRHLVFVASINNAGRRR